MQDLGQPPKEIVGDMVGWIFFLIQNILSYFFGYKTEVFSMHTKPKSLPVDPSYQTNLDIGIVLVGKTHLRFTVSGTVFLWL